MATGQIDLVNYVSLKEAGVLTVLKIGDIYAVSQKTWDEKTWKEGEPKLTAVSKQALIDSKNDLLSKIAIIDIFLADLNKLDRS